MQELDLEGLFWRPEAPNRENSGRLRFDPTDGAILSLIEPFRFNTTAGTRIPLIDLVDESIYILVVLTLLRECDVSIESLRSIQSHQHFKWLAAELGASA